MTQRRVRALPPWLNQGSRGDAVITLQMWFRLHCQVGPVVSLHLNNAEFPEGGHLAACIKVLQEMIGLSGDDIDGNFGQGTRKALRAFMDRNQQLHWLVHPDNLPMSPRSHTMYVDGNGETKPWNEQVARDVGAFLE